MIMNLTALTMSQSSLQKNRSGSATSENTIDREINAYRNSRQQNPNPNVLEELNTIRHMIMEKMNIFERTLLRLDEIEFIVTGGSSRPPIEKIKSKKIVRNDSLPSRDIIDIILVQRDVFTPQGYENVLLITSENFGELVYMRTEYLEEICQKIISTPNTTKFLVDEIERTGKYGILNDDGDWVLMENSETSVIEDDD